MRCGSRYQENLSRHRSLDTNSIAQFTAAFFATFGVLQLMAVLLIGPALAAGTIAQERERRTMEYLYATPLSNLEIIIGKLGGRVLQILYLVLSGVPVLALAMLLGGIAPRAIIALTAVTLSTVLFVTMVSIAVSAWTAKARDAVIRAYLVFFCLWVLPLPALPLSYQAGYAWLKPIVEQVIVANPVVTFTMILSGDGLWGPLAGPWELLLTLVRNQMLVGGMALVLATLFMRRIHLRESGKAARKRRWRIQFFRGEIGDNPMYWKELYAEPGSSRLGLMGYGLLAVIFSRGVRVHYLYVSRIRTPLLPLFLRAGRSFCEYATCMSTFLSCCGLLLLTARAAGSITSEKERDCWVSLISTPLDARQIVKAKILGSLWSLRGLVPFLAVVWLPALLLRPPYFWAHRFLAAGPGDPGGLYGHAGRLLLAEFHEHASRHGRRDGNRHRGRWRLYDVLLPGRGDRRTGRWWQRNANRPGALHAISAGLAGFRQPYVRLNA